MKKTNKRNLYILAFVALTLACGKMDDTYREFLEGGEHRYAGRVISAYTTPGNEMLSVTWKVPPDPNINEFRIFWNNRRDSLAYPYDRSTMPTDTLSVDISPLVPATYYFEIYSYDTQGNRSVKTEFTGVSYPEGYEIIDPIDEGDEDSNGEEGGESDEGSS